MLTNKSDESYHVDTWDTAPSGQAQPESTHPAELKTAMEGGMPVRWLYFYTYIAIPLSVIVISWHLALSFGGWCISNNRIAASPFIAVSAFNLLVVIILVATIFGLHRRRRWGWNLNWGVLALKVIIQPLISLQTYFVCLAIAVFVWFIPNLIYFAKRRHLFQ